MKRFDVSRRIGAAERAGIWHFRRAPQVSRFAELAKAVLVTGANRGMGQALVEETLREAGICRGPIDTDMNRSFEIPKASPESAAVGIFDGLENEEEDIFPDPASQSLADGWRTGAVKALRAAVCSFCAGERGEFGMTLRM